MSSTKSLFCETSPTSTAYRVLRATLVTLSALITLVAMVGPLQAQATPTEEPSGLAAALSSDPLSVLDRASSERQERIQDAARAFYEGRDWQPAWTGQDRPSGTEERIPETLEAAFDHGLYPADYRADELAERLAAKNGGEETLADIEAATTLSLLLYAEHLSRGRFDPEDFDIDWHIEPREIDLAAALNSFLEGEELTSFGPQSEGYLDLVEILRTWRETPERGEEGPGVPAGETMKAGGTYEASRLLALTDRLLATGSLEAADHEQITVRIQDRPVAEDAAGADSDGTDEPEGEADSQDRTAAQGPRPFPDTLVPAVERFQDAHGLAVDGMVGPNTLEALNGSSAIRLERVVLNLERWRWLPELPEGRFLLVNVPAFRLRGFESGEQVLDMPVVVGKPSWATPVFRDTMTDVVINPYWNVPEEIAVDETIPELKKDASYLSKKNFEIVDGDENVVDPSTINWESLEPKAFEYRFRQKPGPENSLGQIKFLFPNQFDVYLHDTPAQQAFERDDRDLSHGCVRVERPLEVAEFVFANDSRWSKDKVQDRIESKERDWISLDEEIPVWIVYFTVYRGENGQPILHEDVYGYDQQLTEALDRRYKGTSVLDEIVAEAEEVAEPLPASTSGL